MIYRTLMPPSSTPRPPRWYTIPIRVLLVTFIGTLIFFAISLLLGILSIAIVAAIHHAHPNMKIAYRQIALPMAAVAGSIIFVLALFMEIRHYRQMKSLSAIARVS
jgi:hypothetical protein